MTWELIEKALSAARGPDDRPAVLLEMAAKERANHAPYYRFLYELARIVRPALSVELGVRYGTGALHLSMGHLAGTVLAVDITPRSVRMPLYCQPNIRLVIMDAAKAAQVIATHGDPDIVFFDTSHQLEQVRAEEQAITSLCSPGCIQLFDDITNEEVKEGRRPFNPVEKRVAESMDRFWANLPGDKRSFPELHPGRGFGVRIIGK